MKRAPTVTTVDFETLPIMPRPDYPPEPVGVSILLPNEKKARYYAWGHPTENNCTKKQGIRALQSVWKSNVLLFQNGKFDVDVAQTHMDCGPISWERIEDTMFLLFLHDPHARSLELKPASEKILGMPPEERDRLKEWILEHRVQIAREFGYEFTPKEWGGAIAYAPGGLVGEYANSDCDRTLKLFKYLWPRIVERGMLSAYNRERELMPILLENERVGLRVDLRGLERDIKGYTQAVGAVDLWLQKRLKTKDLNLDNDNDVATALSSSGVVLDSSWNLTATGRRSVSKTKLRPDMYTDSRVAAAFGYRNRLSTCLKMFMLPWAAQARARPDQHVSTNWNQVRQERGGTRTGRPSTSDPNFLNISKSWDDKDDDYAHPGFLKELPELPLVRKYLLPDKGDVFCHRDYNGQELRIFAHFEDGPLMAAYAENPRMDVHAYVRQLILDIVGKDYHRLEVKKANFRRIYGGGAPAMAEALNTTIEAAKALLAAHGRALPGLVDLNKAIKQLSADGEPIITWGGREYYVEEPGWSDKYKRHMTYEYKLINYLVQGSAADVTKQAIINYNKHPERKGRFLVTVYDEINVSAPKLLVPSEMRVLGECMESIAMDVPMLTDGKIGPSWGDLTTWKEAA